MENSQWGANMPLMLPSAADDGSPDQFLNLHFDSIDFGTMGAMTQTVGDNMMSASVMALPTGTAATAATAQAQAGHVPGHHYGHGLEAEMQFKGHLQLQQLQRQLHQQQQQLNQQQQQLHQQQQQQRQQQQQSAHCLHSGLLQPRRQHHPGVLMAVPGGRIPPTPQSLEITPVTSANRFFSPHDHSMLDLSYHGLGNDAMVFTPLVSPAVTPLEQAFAHAETAFAMHGGIANFSPLTSPALHATTDSPFLSANQHSGGTSENSPTEMDLDAVHYPAPSSSRPNADNNDGLRKTAPALARKPTTTRAKPSIRQSPIVKPQRQHRRKALSTNQVSAHIIQELRNGAAVPSTLPEAALRAGTAKTLPAAPRPRHGGTSDKSTSSSPEPLSEMPPPPLPHKAAAAKSPEVRAANSSSNQNLSRNSGPGPGDGMGPVMSLLTGPSPATPASLLRLPTPAVQTSPALGATHGSGQGRRGSDGIEDLELPKSVSFEEPELTMPCAAQNVTAPVPAPGTNSRRRQPSTAHGASSTPHFGPALAPPSTPKPSMPKPPTPQIQPQATKTARKRGSTCTSAPSPALRPTISPAIRPLLPGGGGPTMAAEDETLKLLATKSNYTRLLEGNNMLAHPSELATNLTSKRTSHKIAEQGRRNRINTAIQQIATLLPPGDLQQQQTSSTAVGAAADSGGDDDDDDKKDGKNAPHSKARTVEMAIEYIRQLQEQAQEANRRADAAEQKLLLAKGGGG